MIIDTSQIKKLIKDEKDIVPTSYKNMKFYQGFIAGLEIIEEFVELYEHQEGMEIAEQHKERV